MLMNIFVSNYVLTITCIVFLTLFANSTANSSEMTADTGEKQSAVFEDMVLKGAYQSAPSVPHVFEGDLRNLPKAE